MFLANWSITFTTKQTGGTINLISAAATVANYPHDSSGQDFLTLTSGQTVSIPITRGDTILIIADHPLQIQLNESIPSFNAKYLLIDGSDQNLAKIVLSNRQAVSVGAQVVILGS